MSQQCPKVLVVGDWDADGIIASAEIVYASEVARAFPVKGIRCSPELRPASPRTLGEALKGGCWDYLILLDIPFTQEVEAALDQLVGEGCRPKLYYFDHHKITIEKSAYIEEKFSAIAFVGLSPTSVLVKVFLESQGVKLTPRLRDLVSSAAILEGGGWLSRSSRDATEGMVKLAASMSKAINQSKDPEMWRKYVRWAASVVPFDLSLIAPASESEYESLVSKGLEVSERSDKEVKEAAMSLAMTAKTVGFVKFVDARDKWRRSGASALASAIYKMTKSAVALWTSREDGVELLIIRSGHGEAMRIAEELHRLGVLEDVGGHDNIASGRVRKGLREKELEDALRRASLGASGGRRPGNVSEL
ncbi:MAG: phosphoesterase [Acidilobus sp.]|jgi:hypothetical protein